MRRFITITAISASMVFGMGIGQAEPGPNGHNNKGLCTAYHNGSQNGRDHKRQAPPFQALERAADAAGDGDGTTTAEEMSNFCAGQIGGRAGRGGTTPGGGSENASSNKGGKKK